VVQNGSKIALVWSIQQSSVIQVAVMQQFMVGCIGICKSHKCRRTAALVVPGIKHVVFLVLCGKQSCATTNYIFLIIHMCLIFITQESFKLNDYMKAKH
jgi:hypothetical protein